MSYSAWLACTCCGQRLGDEEGIPYGYGHFFSVGRLNGSKGSESLGLLRSVLSEEELPVGLAHHIEKLRDMAERAPEGEWVVL